MWHAIIGLRLKSEQCPGILLGIIGRDPKGRAARAKPLEADCIQPFLGWRPASITRCNKIIRGPNFPICKGLRATKLG
jgi:hypothetical protein